jgi:hypothetical protein
MHLLCLIFYLQRELLRYGKLFLVRRALIALENYPTLIFGLRYDPNRSLGKKHSVAPLAVAGLFLLTFNAISRTIAHVPNPQRLKKCASI